ncbi:unnamed protein product [Sphenostylis stenocarpa]|uniref:Uncharacterized protein n=1 Tax=Sphenostylis stenocarpa TaxID=92480 RepID=A0AA86VA17_9FABA|nr:unnamed protein product [Sphenostylis stenocarpa]
MARGAGGESIMSNNEGYQRRGQNLSGDELGGRDQSKRQMKHSVTEDYVSRGTHLRWLSEISCKARRSRHVSRVHWVLYPQKHVEFS